VGGDRVKRGGRIEGGEMEGEGEKGKGDIQTLVGLQLGCKQHRHVVSRFIPPQ
jgi:hypothetical protein